MAVIGDATALVRALRLPIADEAGPDCLAVAVWVGPKALEILARRPRGLLVLGPRPGTMLEANHEHVAAFYETMQAGGYLSIQRWSLPSRCYMDLQDVALRRMASQLLGSEPYYSAQELFAPATDKRPAIDDPVWHRWYSARNALEVLSWADRIKRDGLRAIVPLGFEPLLTLLRRCIDASVEELNALFEALDQHPEAARGVAVWHGMKRQGYSQADTLTRQFMTGLCHENAGHPSAKQVASALCMYFDGARGLPCAVPAWQSRRNDARATDRTTVTEPVRRRIGGSSQAVREIKVLSSNIH